MYPSIDCVKSGEKMKSLFKQAGISVKEIQEYLYLSCPQPIYRWFKGKTLPTVNHLYALSKLLGVHMEELLVARTQDDVLYDLEARVGERYKRRINGYCEYLKYAA